MDNSAGGISLSLLLTKGVVGSKVIYSCLCVLCPCFRFLMGTYVLPTQYSWWETVETIRTHVLPPVNENTLNHLQQQLNPKKPVQISLFLIYTPQDILPFQVLTLVEKSQFHPQLGALFLAVCGEALLLTSLVWRFLNRIHSPSSSRWYSNRNSSVYSCPWKFQCRISNSTQVS